MKIFGIDFTSSPSRQKAITLAKAELNHSCLRVVSLKSIDSFNGFEALLSQSGPWWAGVDFPFGQPRVLIENLRWPSSWEGYVTLISRMTKAQFVDLLRGYQAARPEGEMRHFRKVDKLAGACSPMQLDFVPVAKMFFEGAPRLLASGCCIHPVLRRRDSRAVVEAYPGIVARNAIGVGSYKTDDKQKQNDTQRRARQRIVEELVASRMTSLYGFKVVFNEPLVQQCIEDAKGDKLDAVLCALQAAWAYIRSDSGFGIPSDCDLLEGWIPDPAINSKNCERSPSTELPPEGIAGLVDAVIEIGRERAALLGDMKMALMRRDDSTALRLARRLCGLSEEEGLAPASSKGLKARSGK